MFNEHKSDWKISKLDYRWKDFDYYGQPLYDCSLAPKTDWIKRVHSYLMVFQNGKQIVIEVIEGKEDQVVEQTYKKTA